MDCNRLLRRTLAAVIIMTALSCPPAQAKPTSPLCESGTYRRAHPLICDTGAPGPGGIPGAGGGGGGGLLDLIGDIVGGLTGGLL